jgi:membrane protease YdiL (CAAX protease family)
MNFYKSRFGIYQAIVACVVFIATLFFGNDSFSDFVKNFLSGKVLGTPTPKAIVLSLSLQTLFFILLLIILWASTFLTNKDNKEEKPCDNIPSYTKWQAILIGAKRFVPTFFAALGLTLISSLFFEKVLGIVPEEQDMVRWFVGDTYSGKVKCFFAAMVLVEAPVLEEMLFRGVIFRGMISKTPFWVAVIVSGLMFSIVHLTAVAILPFMYLSYRFACAYRETGSILSPITMHCLFNGVNLAMCFCVRALELDTKALTSCINIF